MASLPYWVSAGYGGGNSWSTGYGDYAQAADAIKRMKGGSLAEYIILSGRHKGSCERTLYVAYRGRKGLLTMQRHKQLHHLTNFDLIPTDVPF